MQAIRTSSPYAMVAVEEALEAILARTSSLATEAVDLLSAEGRVLAEAVRSAGAIPTGPKSAVDGYAVRAEDRGSRLLLADEIAAGPERAIVVGSGEAVRIMTGAPIPHGADAVVMVEDTVEADGRVEIHRESDAGGNIHRAGIDMQAGEVVVEAGSVLGAPEIGLLATVGAVTVRAYRRPRVAVLATGDELVEPWEEPPPGCIRDSNRYALMAAAREAGAEIAWQGVARDRDDDLEVKVREALAASDALITSGGVSMGTRDLIKPLLESLGTIHFGRVNFKPGKPLTFATVGERAVGERAVGERAVGERAVGERMVFGLPGYPVSSLVTFEVFVRPALLKLAGRREVLRARVDVELEQELRPDPVRPEYQRAVVRWQAGRLVARTTGSQGSSRLLSMRGANALLVIQPANHAVPAGQCVPAMLTGEIR